ncbi:MAG: RNA-binding S4 domain-containing protein [Candidatus Eisenbacteria bacterium]|nr:RNA-binding S4 domain-containing protein [Candidatus Eisenbacteria bacterium]
MRLDLFLKVSRLVKQRSAARQLCDAGRVEILGRRAKAATEVRPGDEITLSLRDRTLTVRVVEIPSGNVSKERARALCEVIGDRDVSRH